jgi:hypothetical protein
MEFPNAAKSLWCMLGAGLISIGLSAQTPTDEGVPLLIDVRATVDQRWNGMRKGGPVAHGKVYGLAAVKESTSPKYPLVKPLNESELVRLLRAELAARGFREMGPQEKPDVVLTVTYGRGFLRNPYMEDGLLDEVSDGIPTSQLVSAKQAMRQREAGFEQKFQRAQAEKLHITVSAWKFPEARGEKPHLYWRTVMVTDNPDSRDLNLAMPALLTAGAKYFDRETKEGEVTITTTMPTGTVKLGPLNVIEEVKPRK